MSTPARDSQLLHRIHQMSLAPDLQGVLAEQAERIMTLERGLAHASEYEAMLGRARGAPPSRDRHGMHAVRGSAALAVLGVAGRWMAGHGAKRALALAGAVAVAGTAVTAPSLMSRPASPLTAAESAAGPLRARHHKRASGPPPSAVRAAHHRRRHPAAAPRTPAPSPSPSPGGATPTPTPTPSASASPSGLPAPVPGLVNQGVPSLTSAGLNPGPRLEAGRTVTVKHAATSAR